MQIHQRRKTIGGAAGGKALPPIKLKSALTILVSFCVLVFHQEFRKVRELESIQSKVATTNTASPRISSSASSLLPKKKMKQKVQLPTDNELASIQSKVAPTNTASPHVSSSSSLLPKKKKKQNKLVPLPTDNDNSKIPGRFMNDKLFILGARLTTSYEKLDTSVSFDLFGHAVGEGSNKKRRLEIIQPGTTLSYHNASQQVLFCQVHKDSTANKKAAKQVRMTLMPLSSMDSSSVKLHLIWRCDISPFLSKSDLLASGQTHVRVSVFTEPGNPNLKEPNQPLTDFYGEFDDRDETLPRIETGTRQPTTSSTTEKPPALLTVDVPMDTATVGHAGPLIKSTYHPSFLETVDRDGPLGVMLCVAGISKQAMWYLPEFIQHHLNVGVEHFFLGVDKVEDLNYFEDKLAYYIEEGLVVLGADPIVPQGRTAQGLQPGFDDREVRKMRVYNQCLYHAKGVAEFLAIWDVDELWMPPVESYNSSLVNDSLNRIHRKQQRIPDDLWSQSPYSQATSLPEAANALRGKDDCLDWCFQTFSSYQIHRVDQKITNDLKFQGFYGFPVREATFDKRYQKPIIRTKYAHQASFHLGGSCHRPGMSKTHYSKQFESCPLVIERDNSTGSMHHYYALFRTGFKVRNENFPQLDEYTDRFRSTVVKQLERLQDKVQAENSEWLESMKRKQEIKKRLEKKWATKKRQ